MKKKMATALLAAAISVIVPMNAFAAGWVQTGTEWKYQNQNGSYITNGWYQDAATGKKYFFDQNGNMAHHCTALLNGKTYFFKDSGEMYHDGEAVINGSNCTFDSTGAMVSSVPFTSGTTKTDDQTTVTTNQDGSVSVSIDIH